MAGGAGYELRCCCIPGLGASLLFNNYDPCTLRGASGLWSQAIYHIGSGIEFSMVVNAFTHSAISVDNIV